MHKKFVKKFTFPLVAARYGFAGIYEFSSSLSESQYFSYEEIQALQKSRLQSLLRHAYETTRYYKDLFESVDFSPYEFHSFNDLQRIPCLTKNTIRVEGDSLISSTYIPAQLHSSETGGTTGVKMTFWRNNACLSPKEAGRFRFEQWAGWDFGERMGVVWPAQQDYVGHWSLKAKLKNELYERQVVLPGAALDDRKVIDYLHLLKKKQPKTIRAFTSPICEVARVAVGLNMDFPFLKGIVTTGEPLFRHQRDIIEQAFGCDVFDSYRCREVGPLAQECEEHRGLHINAESLFVEVVEPEDGGEFGKGVGEIVVTDLLNFGMPLIRYRMGDMGGLSSRRCACGRGLPLLEEVSGRCTDKLKSPDGKYIDANSLILYLLDEAPETLGQVQVVQGRIDHLLIRMTPHPPPTDELKDYHRRVVKQLFGDSMQVSFEIVDHIERSASGKYQFTRCLV